MLIGTMLVAILLTADALPVDAPVADLPGTSVSLDVGQPAPFPGRLLSDSEQVRREKVNEAKSNELASLKTGNVIISVPVAVAIVVGVVAASAAITTGVVLSAKKP